RVELIVNGQAVAEKTITADGQWKDISFNYSLTKSAWVALRILSSSHSNPVFVKVDGRPIRVRESAEWCRAAVEQCWKMKSPRIRESERAAARAAYDDAKLIYERIISESQ